MSGRLACLCACVLERLVEAARPEAVTRTCRKEAFVTVLNPLSPWTPALSYGKQPAEFTVWGGQQADRSADRHIVTTPTRTAHARAKSLSSSSQSTLSTSRASAKIHLKNGTLQADLEPFPNYFV